MILSPAKFDQIIMEGLSFETIIGVYEQEKRNPQPVLIDVVMSVMPVQATRTDQLDQTVNYAAAYDRISQIVQSERFELVERLAGCIAEVLLRDHESLMAITVTVRKPKAPIPGKFSGVGITIVRNRSDFGLLSEVELSLGSNLGDRLETLRLAVRHLTGHPEIELIKASSVYETTPVGLPDQPDYLNMTIMIQTTLDPFNLLAVCQETEEKFGRQRLIRWGPRTLDIDLLTYGNLVTQSARLTLPHPRMNDRDFVLVPLREIQTGQAQPTPSVRFSCKLN